jgi:hypothetical protein
LAPQVPSALVHLPAAENAMHPHTTTSRPDDTSLERQLARTDARVQRLESLLRAANRRSRRASMFVACLVLVAFALGAIQATGRVTETGALVIRDDSGTVRAQLGVGEEGAALGLFDARGYLRAGLSAAPDGAILNLFSADGNPRVVVGERGEGAFVVLRDLEGAPRAAMAIQADGTPSLYLLDATMAPLWRQPDSAPQR